MTTQPNPATVRAILAKHHDGDRPAACETCVLADELANNEAILAAHAGETMRIRVEIRDLLSALESGGLVRADRVAARLAQILAGQPVE